jgi:DNA repair exonuclease SbcCD nuclease subunit
MVSFIHTADWQLGAPNLLPACQTPLDNLIEAANRYDVDIIVCAGDIFHRAHPDQQIKDYLLKSIVDNPDLMFVFMAGNHDYINKTHDYSSLRYLSILSSFKLVNNVKVLEPGRYFAHPDAVFWALDEWQDLENVEAPKKNGLPVIALWHGIVPGINIKNCTLNPERQRELAEKIALSGVHYVALGDIHKQWKIHDRCYYSGCLTQTSYVDDLGALFIDVNKQHIQVDAIDLRLPKKLNYAVQFTDGEDSEEEIINFVLANAPAGNLVKLKFNLAVEIYASINKQQVRERLKGHCLTVEFDNDPVTTNRARTNIDKVAKAKTLAQEIDAILDTEELDMDRDKVKKLVLEIINHSVVE